MGYPLKFNVIRTGKLKFPEKGGKFGRHARGSRAHNGWDLNANSGTTVFAVGPGEITYVAENVSGYGTIVQLKFIANGSKYYWALYAHLSKVFVKQGKRIEHGGVIGLTGNTGNAKGTPPHLHFEVATSGNLMKGRNNLIDPSEVLGEFLRDNEAGRTILVERDYPSQPLSIEEIEYAIKLKSIA